MTITTLLYALALVAYTALAVRVLSKRPRTVLNWTAALVLAGLAVWSVEDIVHGIPSASLPLVRLFADIGVFGWGTFASMILVFALVLTGRRRVLKSWPSYILLAGLPALSIYAQFTGRINAGYALGPYGWTTVWSGSWMVYSYYAYYISFGLASLFLFWQFRRRAQHWHERRQATVLLSTTSAALILGTLTDVVVPLFTNLHTPDLAGVLMAFWAGGIYYAVTRYGLMSVTPQAAAADILATMRDSLLLLAPDGRVVTANQAAMDLLGFQKQELVGKPAGSLFTSPGRFLEALGQATRDGELNYLELACQTNSGQEVPVSISARAMRGTGDDPAGTVWVLRDITGRREYDVALHRAYDELERKVQERTTELSVANQALRESEERYRRVNENIQDFIYAVDDQMRMTFASGNSEGLLGIPADRLVGQRLDALAELVRVDRPGTVATFQLYTQAIAQRRETFEAEVELPTPNRGTRWVEVRARIQYDRSGRATGSTGVVRDVTERKWAAEQLRRRTEDLTLINVLNGAANRGESLEGLIRLMSSQLTEAFGGTSALVSLVSEDGRCLEPQNLVLPAALRRGIEKTIGVRLPSIKILLGEGSRYGDILAKGKAVLVTQPERIHQLASEYTQNPSLRRRIPTIMRLVGIRSVVIAPLVSRDRPLGMLELSSRNLLSEQDAERLRTVGEQVTAMIERKRAEEREKRQLEELTVLSRNAMELVQLETGKNIYEFIGSRAHELAGDCFVAVSSFDSAVGGFTVRAIEGVGEHLETFSRLIGRHPVGTEFRMNENEMSRFAADKLTTVARTLSELRFGAWPPVLFGAVERLLRLGALHSMSLYREQTLLGTVVIIMRRGAELNNANVIETFINQAAVALQRRLAEDELERYRLHLEELVEHRTAELKQAQENLVRHERLATLGRVAGSVAHEIRNPLGAIRNAAYFLKLTASDKLEGKAAKHLQVINDEIIHCNQIITSLLDLAQGRLCEPRPCRLTGILSQATTRAELPRITEVETRLPENLPEVLADPDQIEQVFVNLITNAHQAMPSGGRITIAATRTNGHVRVRVSDTGAGIAPEHMKRLFEPLFSTKTFGVGLGLAICKSFIEANKGTVEVESEPGKGTTATVTLPVAAASEVRDPGP